jgi:hypothetical protein
MKIFIFLFISIFSLPVLSQDEISKEHVLSMLEEMKKEGIVPAHEAPKVEAQIKALTPEQFGKIKNVARGIAEKNPTMKQEKAPTLQSAAESVDTDSDEFKEATKELDKILKNP